MVQLLKKLWSLVVEEVNSKHDIKQVDKDQSMTTV